MLDGYCCFIYAFVLAQAEHCEHDFGMIYDMYRVRVNHVA